MKEELLSRLDLLAAKLGIATEHLWEVLTQQGTIEGVYGLIWVVVGAGLLMALVPLGRTLAKAVKDDSPEIGIPAVVLMVLFLLFGLVGVLEGIGDTRYLFNPEYFALEEVMDMLRG